MMMDSRLEDLVFAESGDEPATKRLKCSDKQPVNKANLLDETVQWFFYFLLNLINTPNQELNSLMRPLFDLRNNTIYFF